MNTELHDLVADQDSPESTDSLGTLSLPADSRTGFLGYQLDHATVARRRHSNPRVRKNRETLIDVMTSGHGWVVKSGSEVSYVRSCSECGSSVVTDLAPCEFPHIPWDQCGCNSCRGAVELVRTKVGRPTETCSPTCKRKRRNRLDREKRAADKLRWAQERELLSA